MRVCEGCGEAKPLTDYWRDKSRPDGLRRKCKKCLTADNKKNVDAYRERHGITSIVNPRTGRIRNTARVREQKKAWRLANPDLVKRHKQAEYMRDRDKIIDRVRQWRKKNPWKRRAQILRDRAHAAGAAFWDYTTPDMLKARFDFYGGRCAYCGADAMAFDHRIPLRRGGPHLPANLVPCCRSCNSSKNWRKPSEWKGVIERP